MAKQKLLDHTSDMLEYFYVFTKLSILCLFPWVPSNLKYINKFRHDFTSHFKKSFLNFMILFYIYLVIRQKKINCYKVRNENVETYSHKLILM